MRCEVEKAYPSAVFYWSECVDAFYNCSSEKVGWFKQNGNSSTNESTLKVTLKQQFYKVNYRCTARNKLGQDTLVQEIINKSKISILSIVFPLNKTKQNKTKQNETKRFTKRNVITKRNEIK